MKGAFRFNPARSLFARIFVSFWAMAMLIIISGAMIGRFVLFDTEITEVGTQQLAYWNMVVEQIENEVNSQNNTTKQEIEKSVIGLTRGDLLPIILLDEAGNAIWSVPPHVRPDIEYLRLIANYEKPVQFQTSSILVSGPLTLIFTLSSEQELKYTLFLAEPRPLAWLFSGAGIVPIIALLVVISISGIICFLLAYSLFKPLERVKQKASAMMLGNFSTELTMPRYATKDVHNLADTLNKCSDKITTFIQSNEQLLADISHEIRTPLTRQQLALDLLIQENDFDQQIAIVSRIRKENKRIEALLANLLEYSKLKNHELTEFEQVTINDVLTDVIHDVAIEANSLNKLVTSDIGFINTTITIDKNLFVSAIENVARNAVKHAKNNVYISHTIVVDESISWCCIEIEDDGKGVPKEQRGKLLEPFYRTDNSRNAHTGGVGLGLSIAKRAIELHGGTIHLTKSDRGGLNVKICIVKSN